MSLNMDNFLHKNMTDFETKPNSSLRTVEWKNNKVVMIDQTKLPNELV